MSIVKRIGVIALQTIGGYIGGLLFALIVDQILGMLFPNSRPALPVHEEFAFRGIPLLFAIPIGVAASVWGMGYLCRNDGNLWLTLLGSSSGFITLVVAQYISFVFNILVPLGIVLALFSPIVAAVAYQLSAISHQQTEVTYE